MNEHRTSVELKISNNNAKEVINNGRNYVV